MPQAKEKEQPKSEGFLESMKRLQRFSKTTKETQKKGDKGIVKGIQSFGRSEMERKKKEAERKKKQPVNTAPSEGVISRLYKRFFGPAEKEKQ